MLGASLLVAGCGVSNTASDTSDQTTTAAATSTDAPPGNSMSGPSAAKVSANTASDSEIESALAAAGVSNPGRWAHEVVEYRPYPTDDPNLQKLRDNLAKYNPGEETVDKIVSALKP